MKEIYTLIILAGLIMSVLAQNNSFTGGTKDPEDIFGAIVDNTALGLQKVGANGVAIGVVFVISVSLIFIVLVLMLLLFMVVSPISRIKSFFK